MQDVLIIGAGIFGLSIARKLHQQGRDVVVVDAEGVGAGASATPLGVLAPHAPDRWNPAKEAQFQALSSLPAHLRALEQETGLGVDYQRMGRLIPLRTANLRAIWESRVADAAENWRGFAEMRIIERPDPNWLAAEAARFGAVHCGLTARIDAPSYLNALAASLGPDRVRDGYRLTGLTAGEAVFANGERIRARRIVLATGAGSFAFMPQSDTGETVGRGEVGRLVEMELIEAMAPPETLPLIFERGCYVVPRGGRRVAVGVTSEAVDTLDEHGAQMLEDRIATAQALCPALKEARVLRRWSGTRPRMNDKAVFSAPHPELSGIWVATGGFKTGLATAHTLSVPLD